MTIRVIKDLCLGCGQCAQVCRHNAIILHEGRANILQEKCTRCGACIAVCPSGAIRERVPVSAGELKASISRLQKRTDELLNRIEKYPRTSSASK